MTSLQTVTSRGASEACEKLRDGMRWTVQRGRLFASLRVALLCVAGLIGGLFIVAICDVLFDLPGTARIALLLVLLIGSLFALVCLAARPWLNKRDDRPAGEQIDHAAELQHQPVTVALSLNEPMNDDTLALELLKRAEAHAATVAKSVKPKQAYPMRRLRRQGVWLGLALGLWLLLVFSLWLVIAIVVPNKDFSLVSRVLTPWRDSPPFSLTHLDPQWAPRPVAAGRDVLLSVEPEGLMPEQVDWVRFDAQGKEAERYAMAGDGRGGFKHVLKRLESPIDFRLEAFGRHTRLYTITPTPRPAVAVDDGQDSGRDATDLADGSTNFDPDKVARRDLESHRDWPGIKADLEQLLQALADAQAAAEGIDPADLEAMQDLAAEFEKLSANAKEIAGKLAAMQGDLPAEASALLDQLKTALMDMQSASLPAPPSLGQSAPGSGEPTPSQWLDQAAAASQSDQQQIGKGLGPSDVPSDSGAASGQQGDGPRIVDPEATGTYDEMITSGADGPLPEAVMRQIPPSYRAHVSAYFERLTDEQDR